MELSTQSLLSLELEELHPEQAAEIDGGFWPLFVTGVVAGWHFMDKYYETRAIQPCLK